MISQEGFGTLIPDPLNKKLQQDGVQFSELRQAGKTPENLIEAIYRFWRGGSIRVERNWNGILDESEIVQYATVPVCCRMTGFILIPQPPGICGSLQPGMLILSGHVCHCF